MNDTQTQSWSPILGADGREMEALPIEVAQIVDKCDATLRRHGMQMQIICEHCASRAHPAPYVQGDNHRGASTFTMTCPHARRVASLT